MIYRLQYNNGNLSCYLYDYDTMIAFANYMTSKDVIPGGYYKTKIEMNGMKSWKLTELRFIKDNLHLTDVELAKHFSVKRTTIQGTRRRHRILREGDGKFQKGSTPFNKGKHYNAGGRSIETRFKKGQKPSNSFRNFGDVFQIIDGKDKPYLFIKLPHNRQYPYGRYVYEQKTGLKLTKDEVIRFRDGNTINCAFENLMKVTRRENIIMNSNRVKASQSMKSTWAVVRTFEDFGISCPYKLKSRRKAV